MHNQTLTKKNLSKDNTLTFEPLSDPSHLVTRNSIDSFMESLAVGQPIKKRNSNNSNWEFLGDLDLGTILNLENLAADQNGLRNRVNMQ